MDVISPNVSEGHPRSIEADQGAQPRSAPALRRLRLCVETADGVRRLTLYVPDGGWLAILGKIALVALIPVALVQAGLVRWRLSQCNCRYHRRGGLFRYSIGPAALASATVERLLPKPVRRVNRCSQVSGEANVGTANRMMKVDRYGQPDDGGGSIWVVDEFYKDPQAVREFARLCRFDIYEGSWSTTAGSGATRENAICEEARARLADIIGRHLSASSFYSDCDGEVPEWNGCFNLKLREDWLSPSPSEIHNHLNLPLGALAGVVFLDRNGPEVGGTSFWQNRYSRSGQSSSIERLYDARTYRYRPTLRVQSRFNRLILFPSDILHRGEAGYGNGFQDGRLFQVFFFVPPVA
jgi:hypothetical protein